MKKWEIRGTCFQGNRGLEKYRQAGLFILHTALALWQDTADTSNDSKTLTGPAAKILPGIKWYTHLFLVCVCVCACCLGANTVKHVHCRCMYDGNEWKAHMLHGAWIKHKWSLAGDVMVDDAPRHNTHRQHRSFSCVMTCCSGLQSLSRQTCRRRDVKMPFSVGDNDSVISWIY